MSDKQWNRDVFDVLLDDGTEFLAVMVNYSDRVQWSKFAAERKESGAGVGSVDTVGILWCALRRHGLIDKGFSWPSFWPQVADFDKLNPEPVDPTSPGTGSA